VTREKATTNARWLERDPVEGDCTRCGASALMAYPVYSEGGWFDVVKCQECFHSLSRTRGPRLGAIQLLTDRI
jgi:vanillate/4-hydroxybenzoate decarboxylase subunit D